MAKKSITLNDIEDDKDLIAFGNDFFEKSAKAKRKYEQEWLLDVAFVAGDQLSRVNRFTGGLDTVTTEYDPEWVVRTIDNRLLPIYRLMMAKMTKNKPLPAVSARTRQEEDIQAARAATKLLKCHWTTLGLNTKHAELVSWLIITGNCFVKQFWNPELGDRVVDLQGMDTAGGLTPEGLPIMPTGSDGQPQPVSFALGDTDLILRSPFNIYPQTGKTSLLGMRIIGDAEIMNIEEVKDLYGDVAKDLEAEKDNKYVKINNALTGYFDGYDQNDTQEDNDSITVKELYVLPCKRFPRGITYRWAKDILLYHKEECPELPITHFKFINIPGSFWGKGVMEDLIPLQKRWNALLSKVEMHNDLYNDPPILIDPNVIDPKKWTNEPGLLIEKRTPGVPGLSPFEVVRVPQLDIAVYKELEILNEQFEVVPIMNKVSYGKETPNARSGVAINFLQEKDDDAVRPIIDAIETAYAEVFKRDFKLSQENYEEDRGFSIVGEDNKTEWIDLQKAHLDANVDVGVEPGSAMPRSKAADQEMIMNLFDRGFFVDPKTGVPNFNKALEYLEFGSVDDFFQEATLDRNQAQRENEKLKQMQMIPPEYWHNHELHFEEHNRYRKTTEFEDSPPEIKQLFEMHIQGHMMLATPPPMPVAPGEEQPQGQNQQAQPQQQPQAAPPQSQAPVTAPPEEIVAFLKQLEKIDPATFAQIIKLPPEQQMIAATQLMQSMMPAPQGVPAAAQPQQPNSAPTQ
jgi:hypothetical protein